MTLYKVRNNYRDLVEFYEDTRKQLLRSDLSDPERANFTSLLMEAAKACKQRRYS